MRFVLIAVCLYIHINKSINVCICMIIFAIYVHYKITTMKLRVICRIYVWNWFAYGKFLIELAKFLKINKYCMSHAEVSI